MTSTPPSIIAIDGPAASGKSTVGEAVSQRLGFLYFDTGAMYRAVTQAALARGIPIADEAAVGELAATIHIDVMAPTVDDGRQYTVLIDGEDVTWALRTAVVDANVSAVSAYPAVRTALTRQQRRIAAQGRVVMVGRDIGTVVVPEAPLKIYLDASPEERAHRRWLELQQRGQDADPEAILTAMRARDAYDSTRKTAPLRAASDAIIIDTDGMSGGQVVDEVMRLAERFEG
ncbi:MAG TPA: (d)CMP kinase [Caldilineae bacterium]|nr:(d)CMP kinase [Caldilineae bacterium]